MKFLLLLLNCYRNVFAVIPLLNKRFAKTTRKDLEMIKYSLPKNRATFWNTLYAIDINKAFRSVFIYRVNAKYSKNYSHFLSLLFPNTREIEISGDIGDQFVIYHGQGTVLYCKSAGCNLSVWQHVSVGRNPGHIRNGVDVPTIGDNVRIHAAAIVAGGISIGNNVEIGAGSVVLKDVPNDCVVVGNPARIVRMKGERVNITL